MNLSAELTADQLAILRRCLGAMLTEEFLCRVEFHPILGVDYEDVEELLRMWPQSLHDDRMPVVAANTLGALWGYPHHKEHLIPGLTGASLDDIEKLARKVARLAG